MSPSDIISTRLSRTRFSGFLLFSLLFFIVLGPIFFLSPQNVYALDITLAWGPNSKADLAGYRAFSRQEGESYNYNASIWEGDKTQTSYTIITVRIEKSQSKLVNITIEFGPIWFRFE